MNILSKFGELVFGRGNRPIGDNAEYAEIFADTAPVVKGLAALYFASVFILCIALAIIANFIYGPTPFSWQLVLRDFLSSLIK